MPTYSITYCQSAQRFVCHDALLTGVELCQVLRREPQKAKTVTFEKENPIIAIADGLSTTSKCFKASRYWIEWLKDDCTHLTDQWIRQVFEYYCSYFPKPWGTTTTLVSAQLFEKGKVRILNIGDSRAYKITELGEFIQLSYDHTMLNELLTAYPEVDPNIVCEEIKYMLSDCLVADRAARNFTIFNQEYQLKPNETLLLCSDGLTAFLKSEQLSEIWQSYSTNEQRLQAYQDKLTQPEIKEDLSIVVWTSQG
ncbi:PP2C family protein-serine/threonine phosphatase [Lonepinella sp. BR2930]|uniref:PP2C family protein-serine/threonine phosphatase n=1 Tax=Lonepinella sp. BR2930 TaxID=3434554 RepID=UPI003F6E1D30